MACRYKISGCITDPWDTIRACRLGIVVNNWYALLGILLLSHGLLYYSILVIMIFMMANAADNGKGTWYIYRYLRRLQLRH